jgi:ketosteroid isomerase-like protein
MPPSKHLLFACLGLFLAYNVEAQEPELSQLIQQVTDTERAFAASMAERDFDAFTAFLSDEAVFFAGEKPLTGKQQISDAWMPFFREPAAPFSWEPQTVVVLESGTLALSSGPVFDPGGKHVGTFNSIWRLDADGQWRIIFDKGSDVCE